MTIATSAAPRIVDDLTGIYAFKEPEDVASFLDAHPFLVPLLIEVRPVIERYFPGTPVVLELDYEPDAEDEAEAAELTVLFATVQSSLIPGESRRRLKRFDHDWWLANRHRGEGRLALGLRYVSTYVSTPPAVRD